MIENAWIARGSGLYGHQGTLGLTNRAEIFFRARYQETEEGFGDTQFKTEGVSALLAQFPWSEVGSLEEAAITTGILGPVLDLGSRLASASSDHLGDADPADLHLLAALFEVCEGHPIVVYHGNCMSLHLLQMRANGCKCWIPSVQDLLCAIAHLQFASFLSSAFAHSLHPVHSASCTSCTFRSP